MYNCSSNEMLVVEILLTWHCQSLYALVIDYEDVFYEVIGIIRERCFIVRLSKYLYVFMYDLTQMFTHRILLIMDIWLWGRGHQYPANRFVQFVVR